ncbi:TonB C-terminal domain-containing protein, partial [Paracoccus sanguinis]|uniref:TonB C-terminal domain-containing protein n=1 Tax=Paracoccus sanguinis TaxID=1545044 RepID=UPI0018CF9249
GQQGQGTGRATAGAMQSWQRTAGDKVRRHMARTPATGARGTVSAEVVVTVDPSGATRARLSRGSGDARVDAALGRQAARMPRLGAPPDGRPFQATLPVTIRMR